VVPKSLIFGIPFWIVEITVSVEVLKLS
jgi:hypothetical protein